MKKTLVLSYFLAILLIPQVLSAANVLNAGKKYQEVADIVLGDTNAPVTLVEFVSLNCHHCALFYEMITPELMKKYVESKYLRIVYKHFPIDLQSLQAMMLVASVPKEAQKDKFFQVLSSQKSWIKEDIQAVADICGIDQESCKRILKDENLQNAVAAKRFNAEKKYDIPATPMFLIQYPGGEELLPSGIAPASLESKLEQYISKHKDKNASIDQ